MERALELKSRFMPAVNAMFMQADFQLVADLFNNPFMVEFLEMSRAHTSGRDKMAMKKERLYRALANYAERAVPKLRNAEARAFVDEVI